jgi:hypothetical protein
LPGLLQYTNAAAYTSSSAGAMTPGRATWTTPSFVVNGFGRTASHASGFAVHGAVSALDGSVIDGPLVHGEVKAFETVLPEGTVTRYYSDAVESTDGVFQSARWTLDHDLGGAGLQYSSFSLWAYVGYARPGYYAGRPTFWGGHAFGSPTLQGDMPVSGVQAYRGPVGVQWLFPQSNGVGATYGQAQVSFDASSQTVNVSLQLDRFATLNHLKFAGVAPTYDSWDRLFDGTEIGVLADPMSCTAPVDRVTGTFQCVIHSAGAELQGRFYGPGASEVAGVWRRHVPSGPGTNWGLVGGFAAARR